MALLITGTVFLMYVCHSNSEDFERMVSATFASDVVGEHNQISPGTVADISEMTTDEIREAYPRAQARNLAIARAEINRQRIVVVGGFIGACAWFLGIKHFFLRKGPCRDTTLQQSATGKRDTGSVAPA